MKLSIITLTYNNLKYTKRFLESLYKYTSDFELIIVDNGSSDGTVEYIKSLQKENIKIISNKNNLGYSKGNNQGIKIAGGEYIGFLNNDILLTDCWFEFCEQVFNNEKKAGFVSPKQINPIFYNVNEFNFLKLFSKLKKDYYNKSFDECSFACVITKREILDKIGNFDETYTPAFYEDDDLKYRSIMNGYGVYVCNQTCFFHNVSVTSFRHTQNLYKNRDYYYSKYPFAEYLSTCKEEKYSTLISYKLISISLVSTLNKINNIKNKIINRLKKGIIKH